MTFPAIGCWTIFRNMPLPVPVAFTPAVKVPVVAPSTVSTPDNERAGSVPPNSLVTTTGSPFEKQ